MDVKTQEFEDPLKQYYLKKLKYEGQDKIKPLLLVQNKYHSSNLITNFIVEWYIFKK